MTRAKVPEKEILWQSGGERREGKQTSAKSKVYLPLQQKGGRWMANIPIPPLGGRTSRSPDRAGSHYAVIRMLRSGALLYLFQPSHPEP